MKALTIPILLIIFLLIAACGPLATFFAPRGTEIVVTHPGTEAIPGKPEIPATPTSPTVPAVPGVPAQPAFTTIEHGGGGGQIIQAVGGFIPVWGQVLSLVGTVTSTAASIYLGFKASKGATSEKIANAMVLGIAAAGDAAKLVRSLVQEKARDAGVSGPLETKVATLAPKSPKEGAQP